MKKIIVMAVLGLSLTGCSSFEGQLGKETQTFTDDFGRVCTSVKWGESASIDCDYPPIGPR